MNLPARSTSAFELLAPAVQRWVWDQGWTALRDVQERAIGPVLEGKDVVIASATASGKTEAALLPVLSRIAVSAPRPGVRVLCVSPLKALINDQTRRLETMADAVGVPVTPWHGDVAATRKAKLRDAPAGVLLITPESLEAMFVLRGTAVAGFFAGLDAIIVDELHSFIATERGRQLQSLLHRVDLAVGASAPRIGLSATLGDLTLAAGFLRPFAELSPTIVHSTATRREVQLQVRGYVQPAVERDDETFGVNSAVIVPDVFSVTSGGTHLAFVNQRAAAESTVDELLKIVERAGTSDRYLPHHGSLAKAVREDAEDALRSSRPVTVVATTTLELGIDVGAVDSIVQIDPPSSVSSMRQRLGRSGRREGDASILRIYVTEQELTARSAPADELRADLLQAVGMVLLLIEGFNESPPPAALHLSTLVQQVLSLTAQRGGFRADDGWRALCVTGAFRGVTAPMFGLLLQDLAAADLLVQTGDGTIVLGLAGERLVNHYDFYSAFMTSDEYRLVAGRVTLGTLPVFRPLAIDDHILFAGRRWRVTDVREDERVIALAPAPAGTAPSFGGPSGLVDDAVRRRMRAALSSTEPIAFLDQGGRDLLDGARSAYRRLDLARNPLAQWGSDVLLFAWLGDRALDTLALMLKVHGLDANADGVTVLVRNADDDSVRKLLRGIVSKPPEPLELAALVDNKQTEKHHQYLGEDLLAADWISGRLNLAGALAAARELAESPGIR